MCVDMEGTLLTVEETVELVPVPTPAPRRRAPRSRAAAKPTTESTGDGAAEPEAVATLEITPDRSPGQEEAAPESSQEAIASGEPEALVTAEPTPVLEIPTADGIAAEPPAIAATAWESPAVERPVEPASDGRGDLNRASDQTAPSALPGTVGTVVTAGRQDTASHGREAVHHTPRRLLPRGP